MHKRISVRRARALKRAATKSASAREPETRDAKSDHKRVVFYDLETSIVSKARDYEPFSTNIKGMKRRNLIVEIGAVDMNPPGVDPYSSTFHRLVDPRLDEMTLAETLETTNQNVHRTLMYWNKLFSQKKMIEKQNKSTPIEDQLAVFEDLFNGSEFVTAKRALSQFIAFCLGRQQLPHTPILVAHGGKSFDHQIVRAFCHRLHLPQFGNYLVDSLPVARRILPRMKSHSLGKLHNKLIGTDFEFSHHAMADAHALFRVCKALAEREGLAHASDLWSDACADLTHIRGIGPQTSKNLRNVGYDTATLRACVMAHETCPQHLKKLIRNHKSLWKGMRKKWAKPQATREGGDAGETKIPKTVVKWDPGKSFIVRRKISKPKRCKSV